jgi:hypothetical protein
MLCGMVRKALRKQGMPYKAFLVCMILDDIVTSVKRKTARYQRRKAAQEAKRNDRLMQYDDFNRVIDTDNLYDSFNRSKRGVSWKESVQRYEANALRNIAAARRKLIAGESVMSGFMEFTLHERGKIRHIKSVHISERIVQKCLCDYCLNPILTRSLIYDNGASIKGKGVHFALRRLITHLSKFYRQNGRSNKGYALLVDFTRFFDNIDHAVLFDMLERHIADRRVISLIRSFISVFGPGKSLGLGSQISQVAAIFYPNRLDHFIKENLRIKYYGRYMDDLYLIHAGKEYLKRCLSEIKKVCQSIKIAVNEKKTRIVKLSRGMEFLKGKYILLENGKILRRPGKDSARRMRRKLRKFKALVEGGQMSLDDVRQAYQSWRGNYRRRFNAYNQVRYMDKLYNSQFIKTTIGG